MISALHNDQYIAYEILLRNEPRLFIGAFDATNSQTLALANGVVHQAGMFADHFAIRGLYFTRLGWQVLLQEILEAALADKADASAVLFIVGNKPMFFGNTTDFRFFQLTNRKEGMGKFVFTYCMKEVTLVFIGIKAR